MTSLFRISKLAISNCGNTMKQVNKEKTQHGFFKKKMQFVLKVLFLKQTAHC